MSDYHYTECGLSNVVISGIPVEKDDDGDDVITIPAINELHKVIALGIVSHANSISGPELRFLRSEMGYTQAQLAGLVHRDKQSIGRWERGEIEMDGAAEAVIRRLAIEKLKLTSEQSMEDLAKQSIPGAQAQPINIAAANDGHYELLRAAA